MSRIKIFLDRPKERMVHKSLRTHAREAAEYLTGRKYVQPEPPNWPLKKPGRGAQGESSN